MNPSAPPIVGIIGGHGPLTSALFCCKLVEHAQKMRQDHAPSFVMDSIPINMDVAERAIKGSKEASITLIQDANRGMRRLADIGVRYLAIPCNTLHAFVDAFEIPQGTEFLHIADTCAQRIHELGCKKIGLLGSGTTIQTRFYEPYLDHYGIQTVLPDAQTQTRINDSIFQYVSSNVVDKNADETFRMAIDAFQSDGVEAVALCCTDIAGILERTDYELSMPMVDSMESLAHECARRSIE